MTRSCPNCPAAEIDEDTAHGVAICTNCGIVIEESAITNDVQFTERGGGHEVIGQYVSQDRGQPNNLSAVPGVTRMESRELTYSRGRQMIQQISSQLRINRHCQDVAFNFFKMCVTRNFTRGRLRAHVVVACLYMQCRLANTSHLLLDFSDVTQINVFDLGRTLNFLVRSFHMNLPLTDPAQYILRFAAALDLGDRERNVVDLAIRILKRMQRDWICAGRRPTGFCGAALLLAAKAFEINRSVVDIVRVVHISESVVRKRIDEFAATPSGSGLTIEEFGAVDLEVYEDPPSFQKSMQRARERKQKEAEMAKRAEEVTAPQIHLVQKEIEEALRKKTRGSRYAALINSNLSDTEMGELSDEEIALARALREQELNIIEEVVCDEEPCSSSFIQQQMGPSLESLGILGRKSIGPTATSAEVEETEEDGGELDKTGIDEDEIDLYILSKHEANIKLQKWLVRNKEHLEEQATRKRLKEEREEMERSHQNKKRRPARRKREPILAATHSEAIQQIIQEKKLSKKINWQVIEDEKKKVKGEL